MQIIIYLMVAFALIFASGLIWLYWKKRYPGLLLIIGLLIVWSGYAVYLVNESFLPDGTSVRAAERAAEMR